MPLKIGKLTIKQLERPHYVRFWGQRRLCKPVFVPGTLGDGMMLLAVTPLNTRPHYYLIRVDSSWSTSNYDDEPTIGDNIDDILDVIEEYVGPCSFEDDDGKMVHEGWPSLSDDSGVAWSESTYLLPKRLRPKRLATGG